MSSDALNRVKTFLLLLFGDRRFKILEDFRPSNIVVSNSINTLTRKQYCSNSGMVRVVLIRRISGKLVLTALGRYSKSPQKIVEGAEISHWKPNCSLCSFDVVIPIILCELTPLLRFTFQSVQYKTYSEYCGQCS